MNSDPAAIAPVSAVLVSGGSRGLGLAVVAALLNAGARVATFSRHPTTALDALARAHPERLCLASVDVTDITGVESFLHTAQRRFGRLDGLVNNTAIGQDSQLAHTTPARITEIVSTNLTATLLLTRAFIRQLIPDGGTGRIVTVSSVTAQRGFGGVSAYAAAKGGIESAMRSLARELRGRVLVNSIAPGFFASELSAVLSTHALQSQLTRRTPSGRTTDARDIVPVVMLLLTADTNINGATITIDGGLVA